MKKAFTLLALALLVASAAMAQPEKASLVAVRVFTAPDDAGFVTPESKLRQVLLKDVTKKLSNDKDAKRILRLADDAAVTIEILSIVREETGTSKTQTSALGRALLTPSLTETIQIRKTTVRSILRFGGFEKELISTHIAGELGDNAIRLREAITGFVGDNAAKLR